MRNSREKTRINFNRRNLDLISDNNTSKFQDISKFNRTIMTNRSRKTNHNSMDFRFNSTTRRYLFEDQSIHYDDIIPLSNNILKDYKYESVAFFRKEEKEEKSIKDELLNSNISEIDINLLKDEKKNLTTKPIIQIQHTDKLDELFEKEYDHLYSTKKNFFISTVKNRKLESIQPESQTKIYIHNLSYNSPIKSYSTIKKNEVIFGSMVKNYHEIQKNTYNNFLKHKDETAIKSKPDFKKIKISTIIKKKNKFKEITESEEKENMKKELERERQMLEQEKNCKIFFN